MIRRLILILFFTLGTLLAVMAQNSIDRQVERYSAIGQSRFTSAVERDPRTRRVQKVVKVLELYDKGVKALIDAFKAESSNGDFTEKRDSKGLTMILTTSRPRQNRVYMLKCDSPYSFGAHAGSYGHAKVTIIIRYK